MQVKYLDGPAAVENEAIGEGPIERGEPVQVSTELGDQLLAQGWVSADLEASDEAIQLAAQRGVNLADLGEKNVKVEHVQEHLNQLEAEQSPAAEIVVPDGVDVTAAAARLAADSGIDLSQIEGTGKDNKITVEDVKRSVNGGEG